VKSTELSKVSFMQILEAQTKCLYSKALFLKPRVCLSVLGLR